MQTVANRMQEKTECKHIRVGESWCRTMNHTHQTGAALCVCVRALYLGRENKTIVLPDTRKTKTNKQKIAQKAKLPA